MPCCSPRILAFWTKFVEVGRIIPPDEAKRTAAGKTEKSKGHSREGAALLRRGGETCVPQSLMCGQQSCQPLQRNSATLDGASSVVLWRFVALTTACPVRESYRLMAAASAQIPCSDSKRQ